MDENMEKQPQEAEEKAAGYVPRPAWQVWCARVALVIFIIIVIGQILRIARGGF
jgi:hypothetical protein